MIKEQLKSPDFVIQKNVISQSIYTCMPSTRKLIAMAMSLLPIKIITNNQLKVTFSVKSFLKALNLTDGGFQRSLVCKNTVKEASSLFIKFVNTEKEYAAMPWFKKVYYSWDLDIFEMVFNDELISLLEEFKGQAKLNLLALGKLQSFYAIRFYELIMSYKGFCGKKGNKQGFWFFERTVLELRQLFKLENKYKRTGDFRTNVVDLPIRELNNAKLGFFIELEYLRKGRRLLGFRFLCTEKPIDLEFKTLVSNNEIDIQINILKNKFPKEWEKEYDYQLNSLQSDFLIQTPEIKKKTANFKTYEKLKNLVKK